MDALVFAFGRKGEGRGGRCLLFYLGCPLTPLGLDFLGILQPRERGIKLSPAT